MLRSINEITGYRLDAKDGQIGHCKDFLFDDEHWTIRYMVADTGNWLPGQKVLVSPIALAEPNWEAKSFPVRLTVNQIEGSPPLERDAPVSRRYERTWHAHYGWPYYWAGGGIWGTMPYPPLLFTSELHVKNDELDECPEESHLRSAKEVIGYEIKAQDGEIGHVEDFIVDDKVWSLRYVVVNTRHLFGGKKVIVATHWLETVDWHTKELTVDLKVDEVKGSPDYDPTAPVNREYEERVFDYYGRPIHDK